MKRFFPLFLCAALAVGALAGCGGSRGEDAAEEIVPAEEIMSLAYNNGETTLRFSREEDVWVWADDPSFPLDDTRLTNVLAELDALPSLKPLAHPEELGAYGLDKTGRYLTAVSNKQRTTLYFGQQAANGTWYARSAGGDRVYQVPDSLIRSMEGSIYDMAVLPALPVLTAENLVSVTLVWSPESRMHLQWRDGGWQSGGSDVTAQMPGLLGTLAHWTLERCVDYTPSEGAHTICGLETPTVTVTVRYKNAVGADAAFVLTVGDETDDGGRFVTTSDSDTIYRMEDTSLAVFLPPQTEEE